jgi:hypothetical protein
MTRSTLYLLAAFSLAACGLDSSRQVEGYGDEQTRQTFKEPREDESLALIQNDDVSVLSFNGALGATITNAETKPNRNIVSDKTLLGEYITGDPVEQDEFDRIKTAGSQINHEDVESFALILPIKSDATGDIQAAGLIIGGHGKQVDLRSFLPYLRIEAGVFDDYDLSELVDELNERGVNTSEPEHFVGSIILGVDRGIKDGGNFVVSLPEHNTNTSIDLSS